MPNTSEIMELQKLAGMDKFSKFTVKQVMDREKLIELLCETHKCIDPSDTVKEHYSYVADCLIANNVVPVVRCKDCKHKGWIQEPCHGKSVDYCRALDFCINNADKCFCSYGERRTDEQTKI